MKTFLKFAIAPFFLLMSGHAAIGAEDASNAAGSSEPGVVVKVENAIERGAKAAASGVERGVRAAASGVERGTRAAAEGVTRGASAASGAANRVANKITGTPASSPTGSK